MRRAMGSSISWLRSTRTSPPLVVGSVMVAAESRPMRRLAKSSSAEPANSRVSSRVIQVPSSVPQSSSRVMTSWATSTRRRVR